jgi:hypothetical protein
VLIVPNSDGGTNDNNRRTNIDNAGRNNDDHREPTNNADWGC